MADIRTTQIQNLIERLAAGDKAARDELINGCCERLRRLVRKQLRTFKSVRRWEDSDDVLNNAAVRLWQHLQKVTPESPRHFFNMAGVCIRHELHSLMRHYCGPQGLGVNYRSGVAKGKATHTTRHAASDKSDSTNDPIDLASWTEFHEAIGRLADEEREMYDLLWYQKLTQADAATLLGVDERTIRRRWQAARLELRRRLKSDPREV